MPGAPQRTVMSTGAARCAPTRGENGGLCWNEGLVAPELGSLSNSGIGTTLADGRKIKQINKWALGVGVKRKKKKEEADICLDFQRCL